MWSYNPTKKELILEINQTQKELFFSFPLDVAWISKEGLKKTETVQIDLKSSKIVLKADFEPSEVKLAPTSGYYLKARFKRNDRTGLANQLIALIFAVLLEKHLWQITNQRKRELEQTRRSE